MNENNAGSAAGIDLLSPDELRSAARLIRQATKAAPGTADWTDSAQAAACDAAADYLERRTLQPEPAPTFPEVQAEEARLYRDLTGDAMALGFDGLVAALEALRATPQPSADRAPADGAPSDWEAGREDADGNVLVMVRADDLAAAADFMTQGALMSVRIDGRPVPRADLATRFRSLSGRAPTAAPADGAGEPKDIRAAGWMVAVHNDYRLNGEAHTFWLFTKDGRAIKGEGRTDAEALAQVRAELGIAPTAGDSANLQPIYATGGINDIADELEAEALNYEGDFADTVKGCVEALREIAATPQHSVAEQADYYAPLGVFQHIARTAAADMQQSLNRAQPLSSTVATQPEQNDIDMVKGALDLCEPEEQQAFQRILAIVNGGNRG